jgi:L-cysteine/cystine lyase
MDAAEFRAAFPVCGRTAFLGAGTCGPVPQAAADALAEASAHALREGRGAAYYGALTEASAALREGYARVLGAAARDVALTTGTSEAMVKVLLGLGLRAGDEVVTAADEHPGLLGPLAAARDRLGIRVRAVALADVADAVGPDTRLVACSHVSWMTGALAPVDALAALDVPVLLDGAQGAGALDVDVQSLGCAAYCAAGQKWLCGPVGTGMLWVDPAFGERLAAVGPTYPALADPYDALGGALREGAARHDTPALPLELAAAALAALGVLEAFGLGQVWERGAALAGELERRLREAGVAVRERHPASTLVAWEAGDAEAQAARLEADGVLLRWLPGGTDLRASVGAWNDEGDLDQLLRALG